MISRILSVLATLGLVASGTAKVKPVPKSNRISPPPLNTVTSDVPLPRPICSEGQPMPPLPPTCPGPQS
jgi:hypothetical protein